MKAKVKAAKVGRIEARRLFSEARQRTLAICEQAAEERARKARKEAALPTSRILADRKGRDRPHALQYVVADGRVTFVLETAIYKHRYRNRLPDDVVLETADRVLIRGRVAWARVGERVYRFVLDRPYSIPAGATPAKALATRRPIDSTERNAKWTVSSKSWRSSYQPNRIS